MTAKLTLYTRKDCCLCDEMKTVVRQVGETTALELTEIDVDSSAELQERFGDQVPLLFIDGRKAFKYRVSERQLASKLARCSGIWSHFGLWR
jgi:glutaredoxin